MDDLHSGGIHVMEGTTPGTGDLSAARSAWRRVRAVAFLVIGSVIVFAPALPQAFGIHSPLFRQWTMYSGVGTGLLKGRFEVTKANGSTSSFTPREVLGLTRYPLQMGRGQPHQVRSREDLRRVAAEFCGTLEDSETLAFRGWVSTVRGWERLDGTELCEGGR